MKEYIHKDSDTAQINVIPMKLAMTTCFDMRIGVVDISGAYVKIRPIKR